MPLLDVYGRTHELDTKSLDSIATRLEARCDSTRYMGMLHEYLDASAPCRVRHAVWTFPTARAGSGSVP